MMKEITAENLKEMTINEIASYRFVSLSEEEEMLIIEDLRRREA